MTDLYRFLQQTGIRSLDIYHSHEQAIQDFCSENQTLFANACLNMPEKSPLLHLLGILTKSQLELSSSFEDSQESGQTLQEIFKETLEEHADKLHRPLLEQYVVVTCLWLFIQGRLNMDFSLANDHAHKMAQQIHVIVNLEQEALRSELMQHFYQGKFLYQRERPKQSLWVKFKQWLFK